MYQDASYVPLLRDTKAENNRMHFKDTGQPDSNTHTLSTIPCKIKAVYQHSLSASQLVNFCKEAAVLPKDRNGKKVFTRRFTDLSVYLLNFNP